MARSVKIFSFRGGDLHVFPIAVHHITVVPMAHEKAALHSGFSSKITVQLKKTAHRI
jgi:hypothetical protein